MLAHTGKENNTMPKKQTIRQARYDAKNCKHYHFKLVYKTDGDIIQKLASEPSMQGYIKQLIRDDIARTQSEERYTCEHCANNTEETEDGMIICHNDGQKKQKNDTCDQWY